MIEIDEIIDKLEKKLVGHFIVSSNFQDIQKGNINCKRRIFIIALNIINAINSIRSFISAVSPPDSINHFYCLNPFLVFGIIGKFMSGFYAWGYLGIVSYVVVVLMNEARNTLNPFTDVKKMARKLKKPTLEEFKAFSLFLKVMLVIPVIGLISVTIPMALLRGLGAVMTAYKFKSIWFSALSVIDFFVFVVTQQYIVELFVFLFVLIAQTTVYFKLRLQRIESAFGSTKKALELGIKSNHLLKLNKNVKTSLLTLKEFLGDVHQNNRFIKDLLFYGLLCTGGMFSLCLGFVLGDVEWYFKIFPAVTFCFMAIVMGICFSNAAELYVRIRQNLLILQSHQINLQLDKEQVKEIGSFHLVRTKFQILRLIHSLSSHSVMVGYTAGCTESFSPKTVASFLSTVVSLTIMFLNSKHAST